MATTSSAIATPARRWFQSVWRPCLALALTVALLAGEIWAGWPASWPMQIGFGVVFVAALAALLRNLEGGLCGPVLFCDMVRTARRGRHAIARLIYAVVLFGVPYLTARQWIGPADSMTANDLAAVANACYVAIVVVQFAAVICMTPVYAAGAITEEKDSRTLEYLLATDLSNREIILGKFFSRLGNMTLLLLTGLPIVALLQLLGGIDLNVLLMSYAATLLFMISLTALTVSCSVHARRTRGAVFETYMLLGVYLIVVPIFYEILNAVWPRPRSGYEVALDSAMRFFVSGNPFYVSWQMARAAGGQSIIGQLASWLAEYAAFHIAATIGILWWAARRLRMMALGRRSGFKKRRVERKSQRVWGPPVMWKEMRIRGLPRNRIALAILFVLTALVSLAPLAAIFAEPSPRWRAEDFNLFVRIYGTVLSCMLLISITIKVSSTVSAERTKQTLDALLTTPLSNAGILWGKWLGSVLSVRYGLLWLAVIWTIGLATGGLHPVALIWLVMALGVYIAACASIGLWASVISRSTMRAQLAAFLVIACVAMAQAVLTPNSKNLEVALGSNLAGFYWLFLLPPATFARLAFSGREWIDHASALRMLLPVIGEGFLVWSATAAFFYVLARRSFRRERVWRRIGARQKYISSRAGLATRQTLS